MEATTHRKKILVLTDNIYLLQKIRLELSDSCDIFTEENDSCEDMIIVDIDTMTPPPKKSVLTIGHGENADIRLPFLIGALKAKIFESSGDKALTAIPEEKSVILSGEKIRLTDVEYALFSVLAEKRGEYTSREELLLRVWSNGCDGGVINVYIHYLREKLEKHGEKIIISSRKHGYKIDEKFFGGNENA